MADPASTLEAVSLPPAEAIAFLRGKTNTTSQRWTDVWNEAHTRSFMVAGAATQAIVQDFRDAVAKAIEQGTSLAEFRKDFDRIVETHGWEYNGTPGWRSSIIYETNLSTAYSAGRYAQMTEPDTLRVYPYWQYMHTSSAHPRPQHLAWVGTTLRADDSWWSTHYPPNGWRCKCSVRPVSEAGLRRQGKRGPDEAPPVDLRPWRSRDGKIVTEVPYGIDPGFGYNPGKAWQEGLPPPATPRSPLSPMRAPIPAAEAPLVELSKFVDDPFASDVGGAAGSLTPAIGKAIGASVERVELSPSSMAKQRGVHRELAREDYLRLPELLDKPQLVLQETAHKAIVLRRFGPDVLAAFVKSTRPGDRLFVTSFRKADRKDVQRLLRKHAIIAGAAAALFDEKDDGAPEGPPGNPS